ncbi:GAF and ANTAR domain-containing protein [Saccharothrix xinjiangensis]|uniref:GAF and ANTAR domain-containing protein n=1 Tax=Saccharothrix xinjiangensis TaxID=204798 RepID=A0ABV9XYF7_9PSEU
MANHDNDLAVRLSEVARALQQRGTAQDTLDGIVRAAVETIPGARHAGVMTVVGKREVRTVSVTDDLPRQVDQVQFETGQGPCLTALYLDRTISVPDLAADTRWPRFTSRARSLDVGSMLSFQLFVEGDDLGALNLYAPEPRSFDEDSLHVGLLFASHSAVALAEAQQRDRLTQAAHTRDLIGQAKGILMERYTINADQAFSVLVRVSQQNNRKLRDLAEELATTGKLPAEA